MQSKVPILFIISNRPEAAMESFQTIRRYRPDRLYLASDGPSPGRRGEETLCRKTRELILGQIDWPCDVRTQLRYQNVGHERYVNEALLWMLESEEYGVVVEDDRILSEDYLRFCEETLPAYRDEGRVAELNSVDLTALKCGNMKRHRHQQRLTAQGKKT
jgi:hypothetical protein